MGCVVVTLIVNDNYYECAIILKSRWFVYLTLTTAVWRKFTRRTNEQRRLATYLASMVADDIGACWMRRVGRGSILRCLPPRCTDEPSNAVVCLRLVSRPQPRVKRVVLQRRGSLSLLSVEPAYGVIHRFGLGVLEIKYLSILLGYRRVSFN